MELFRWPCSCSRAACGIMRLFFLSASVPPRIIRARYFFTLDVLWRTSCYVRIVTVKRGCYDRHRAPFCGFSRREKSSAREKASSFQPLSLPLSFSLISSLPLRRHRIPHHAYLTFNGRRKLCLSLALFRRHSRTDAAVTGKRDGN